MEGTRGGICVRRGRERKEEEANVTNGGLACEVSLRYMATTRPGRRRKVKGGREQSGDLELDIPETSPCVLPFPSLPRWQRGRRGGSERLMEIRLRRGSGRRKRRKKARGE